MSRNPLLILLAVLASFLFTSNAYAVYHVETGRFLQKDPHGTGVPLITDAYWFNGRAPLVNVSGFNHHQQFRDGMNLYQYLRSNPVNRSDPLGLYAIPAQGSGPLVIVGVGGMVGLTLYMQTDAYQSAVMAAAYATEDFMAGTYDSAEALYGYAESRIAQISGVTIGTSMAVSQKDALRAIHGQVDHILLHLAYLDGIVASGSPDPNQQGWLREVRAALKTIEHKIESLGQRTAAEWRAKLEIWKEQFINHGGQW